MNKYLLGIMVAGLFLSCSNPNQCDQSEKYNINTSHFVLDKGYNKYSFKFAFEQKVEIWTGDCSAEKSVNDTNLKLTSNAPCDQTVNFTIDVNMGLDSYQFKMNNVVIKSQETIDFGLMHQGGGRIDGAQVEIALYCPLCPGD
jgi:hypothetical protein